MNGERERADVDPRCVDEELFQVKKEALSMNSANALSTNIQGAKRQGHHYSTVGVATMISGYPALLCLQWDDIPVEWSEDSQRDVT
jgi:hypothetical protein